GLVDAVTPRRHFENAARQMLASAPPPHQPPFAAAITNAPGVRAIVAKMSEKKVAERARRDHYPAPYAIIETWRDFGGDPRNVPKANPASMVSLFHHPTTRNLIRIFTLQDRLKAFGKDGAEPVRHLHVVGAGAMGGDIAAWCALRGINVTLQ